MQPYFYMFTPENLLLSMQPQIFRANECALHKNLEQ